jgi:mannose-1-phosphate guanylyltransferase/mannose-6-phosphate isomerase
MSAIGVEPKNIILEPFGRNTAPAAAVAALMIAQEDPEAILLVMPADHVIGDPRALREAIDTASRVAREGHLVTFGIRPTAPDTGYGYIRRGAALQGEGKAFAVSRFVEKPDALTAARYVAAEDYYWNSGMFTFQASTYLAELQRSEPDVIACSEKAISGGILDNGCLYLDRAPFEACKSISIDYAVMEHTEKAALVPTEMGWSDIGTWGALWEIGNKNPAGNVIQGDVLHYDSQNSYLRSEGPLVAAVGVKDLVVVASPDAILVSSKSASQNVKNVVEQLVQREREEPVAHRRSHYSWGTSERLDQGETFQVDRVMVNPGAALLLRARDDHAGRCVTVSGSARISKDGETYFLKENETLSLSGSGYRLENPGRLPLIFIAINCGADFPEGAPTLP